MSMMICPECGYRVSSFAERCAHCGFPVHDQEAVAELERTPRIDIVYVEDGDDGSGDLADLIGSIEPDHDTRARLGELIGDTRALSSLFPEVYKALAQRGSGVEYVADIPKRARDLMRSGELTLTFDKSGRILPLLKRAGKGTIESQIRLKEVNRIPGIPGLPGILASLQTQVILAQISMQLDALLAQVGQVREGQFADRIAMCDAVVDGLRATRAMNNVEVRESRYILLVSQAEEAARLAAGELRLSMNELSGAPEGLFGALGDLGGEKRRKEAVKRARAALWGVLKQGAKKVSIGVRNPMKGMLLCEDFAADGDIQAFHFSDAVFSERLHAADLIIQTTPMGMAPHIQEMPPIDWSVVNPKAVAYDLIYTPMKTRFLREAEQHGLSVVNGEDMLIAQGAEAFYLWTGVRPDVEVMTHTLREELRRRG